MSIIQIRKPHITAVTAEGKMAQITSYLWQLAEQLEWALNNDTDSTFVFEGSKDARSPKEIFNAIEGMVNEKYLTKLNFEAYKAEMAAVIASYKDTVEDVSTVTVGGIEYRVRKWASGDMEVWGRKPSATVSGSVKLSLPAGFKSISYASTISEGTAVTTQESSGLDYINIKVTTNGTALFNVCAKGKWK